MRCLVDLSRFRAAPRARLGHLAVTRWSQVFSTLEKLKDQNNNTGNFFCK